MSHCTTFQASFQDKRLLFRAMRNIGLNPENKTWVDYGSRLQKKLGIGGKLVGKLLTGTYDGVYLLFVESDHGLIPHAESSVWGEEELEMRGTAMLYALQQEYARGAVHQLAEQFRRAGVFANIQETETAHGVSFVLTVGQSGKSIAVSINSQGVVEEQVSGIAGRSCLDATAFIEQKLAQPTAIHRTWTHEFNATIEDKTIQVLRLSQN